MDVNKVVVFYSKYSNACKKFITVYNSLAVPGSYMVCVDSREIHDSMAFKGITKVPAVMIILNTNEKVIYQGQDAFEWLKHIQEEEVEQPPQVTRLSQPPMMNFPPPQEQFFPPPQQQPPQQQQFPPQQQQFPPQQQPHQQFSMMPTFDSDDLKQSEAVEPLLPPPRNGSGMSNGKPTPDEQKAVQWKEKMEQMKQERLMEDKKYEAKPPI